MAGYESTAFSKKMSPEQTPKMREFSVGEEPAETESDWINEQEFQKQQFNESKRKEQEIQQLKLARQRGTVGVTEFAKQRIEYLTNLGRQFKEVKIDGIIFTLRTLKAKEIKEALSQALLSNAKNDLELSLEIQRQQLSRAIYKIDGQELEIALGSSGLEAVFYLLDNSEENVYDLLMEEYSKLRDESKAQFNPKDKKEMKEVVEDLKK